ncbi:MAG: hypothetical protein MR209_04375 [Veillonellaceae bacterium]|nr:hypothetical protein [Veillonellaceae bacterium]
MTALPGTDPACLPARFGAGECAREISANEFQQTIGMQRCGIPIFFIM